MNTRMTHARPSHFPRSDTDANCALFDVVYTWLRNAPVRQAGHNYALYDRCTPQTLRMGAGIPVSGRFPDTDLVKFGVLFPVLRA